MARPKGSLNKKNNTIELKFDKKTDVLEEHGEELEQIQQESGVLMKHGEELEQIQQEIDLSRVELEKTRLEIETKKHELKLMQSSVVEVKPAESPSITIKDNALKEKIAAQKAYDNEMVTGKFYNLRVKGQSVKLPYHKYTDDVIKWHEFHHGQVKTIPRGFADQINGGTESDPCHYTPHFIKNEGIILNADDPESGIHSVDTSDKKYSFVPLNF